jgi:hypothetical protein
MEDRTNEGRIGSLEGDSVLRRANTALIRYPRFKELHEKIRRCQELSKIAGEPQCLSLEGAPGAGKTTLIRDYAAAFPREDTASGTRVPILYLEMPSPATVKGVAAAMLGALRDPAADRGPLWSMNSRLVKLIVACRVEFVILDDIQHLIDSETDRVLEQVSNWLKVLIKETGAPFLIVGIEDTIERILDLNPQLSRLFAARETLKPFAWDEADEKAAVELGMFVRYAEEAIGMELSKERPRRDMLHRLYYATDGIVGNLMNLLRNAMLLAREQGRNELDLAALAAAFQERLAVHLKN